MGEYLSDLLSSLYAHFVRSYMLHHLDCKPVAGFDFAAAQLVPAFDVGCRDSILFGYVTYVLSALHHVGLCHYAFGGLRCYLIVDQGIGCLFLCIGEVGFASVRYDGGGCRCGASGFGCRASGIEVLVIFKDAFLAHYIAQALLGW